MSKSSGLKYPFGFVALSKWSFYVSHTIPMAPGTKPPWPMAMMSGFAVRAGIPRLNARMSRTWSRYGACILRAWEFSPGNTGHMPREYRGNPGHILCHIEPAVREKRSLGAMDGT